MPKISPAQEQQRRAQILAAAMACFARQGYHATSMDDVVRESGLSVGAIYSYFPSKHAIYDAMFADGNRRIWEDLQQQSVPSDPRQRVKSWARAFVRFCCDDPALYQLLFQRSIPGFEPSRESMDIANRSLEWGREALADAGIRDPAGSDMLFSIISGLISQQTANEPGGDRWIRLCDGAVQMFFDYFDKRQGGRRDDHDG